MADTAKHLFWRRSGVDKTTCHQRSPGLATAQPAVRPPPAKRIEDDVADGCPIAGTREPVLSRPIRQASLGRSTGDYLVEDFRRGGDMGFGAHPLPFRINSKLPKARIVFRAKP